MYEVEFTKKNLVITDPCYLDNMMDGVDDRKFHGRKEYWEKFLKGAWNDDWSKNLSRFNFTTNITCDTRYGDWSCTAYYVDFDPKDIKTFEDLKKVYNDIILDNNGFGNFCADAGMVCVVASDEVNKFNPGFFEWAFMHRHCVTVVKNFTGTVGVLDIVDETSKYNDVYRILYGIADKDTNPNAKNFITFQTGF